MAQQLDARCSINELNRCCCNCQFHIQDFHHCTTVPNRQPGTCHCDEPKGWICIGELGQEGGHAHSNWSDHGECEMHEYKKLKEE